MTTIGKFTTEACQRCGSVVPVVDPRWLRAEREWAGLTLREMACRLGVSATYLSDVERGRRSALPRIVTAYDALGPKEETPA